MHHTIVSAILLMGIAAPVHAGEATANPRVLLETSKGDITLELYVAKAPETVKNFLAYVAAGFYDDTIFHRVIPGFMVQGGGLLTNMSAKPTNSPIGNEADNGLANDRGTVAMARTSDPHSATVQFFINTVDNDFLNFKSKTPSGWGYTVFGRVVEGMAVVDAISEVDTTTRKGFQDVPQAAIVIQRARRLAADGN